MKGVELQKLTKSYGEANVVDHIDLNIEEGKFFSILGPSGCGKNYHSTYDSGICSTYFRKNNT